MAAVTHVFLLALQNMGSMCLLLPLRARGFMEQYSITGFFTQSPYVFAQRGRDTRSFAASNPDAVLSCFEIKVHIGICFPKQAGPFRPALMNTCSGRYPLLLNEL